LVTMDDGKSLHFPGDGVKMKMQIVKEHYRSDSIYMMLPWIRKDANMTCSTVTKQMLLLRQNPSRRHKDVVVCQADGGSENWNKTVMGMAGMWVYHGVCK
jgi:hypothetical protein